MARNDAQGGGEGVSVRFENVVVEQEIQVVVCDGCGEIIGKLDKMCFLDGGSFTTSIQKESPKTSRLDLCPACASKVKDYITTLGVKQS